MSKVNKDDYLDLYEYVEDLADKMDELADSIAQRVLQGSGSISNNLSDALVDTGELVRKAEDRLRRAL